MITKPQAQKTRRCLKCDSKFVSKGIYNRLCAGCIKENKGIMDFSERFYLMKVYGVWRQKRELHGLSL